jgi:hypothetical protein
MSLLALVCPRCAAPLPVGEELEVFVCKSCARNWFVSPDENLLVPLERTLVRPLRSAPSGAAVVLLPVWAVRVRVQSIARAPRGLPVEVRVPAVGVRRLPLLLGFARNLTRAPEAWQAWEGGSLAVEPAELSAADAFALAEMIVLRHVDGWPGDAGLQDLEIPFGGARLLDWPCACFGGELLDLVAGLSTQRALIDGIQLSDHRDALHEAMGQSRTSPHH